MLPLLSRLIVVRTRAGADRRAFPGRRRSVLGEEGVAAADAHRPVVALRPTSAFSPVIDVEERRIPHVARMLEVVEEAIVHIEPPFVRRKQLEAVAAVV